MKKLIIMVFSVLAIFLCSIRSIRAEGWGFKRNCEHEIPDIGRYESIIKDKNAYYVGEKGKVYLTFDCGYDNGNLSKILNTLREKEIAATFFVTGDFVDRFTPLLEEMVRDGHVIGNHSYRHLNITKAKKDEISSDLKELEDAYYDKIGAQMAKIFRPPEGCFDEKSLNLIKKMGYKTIFWSIAYVDWNNKNVDSYAQVMDNLHDGAIILMHSVSTDNADNLGKIIDAIREKGYQFDVVTNL